MDKAIQGQPLLKAKATMIARCFAPFIGVFIYAIGFPALLAAADLPVTGRDDPKLAAFDRTMLKFMVDHDVPGGALAIARHGKIVYARGFGFSNIANHTPVDPDALFRIASVSKPFTSAAILQLVERGQLKLTDHPFEMLAFKPHLENNARVDPRLYTITIHQLLHHTGGFDRTASFDPMFRPIDIAKAIGTSPPAGPSEIIEYMMGRPLDFAPGTKEAYSNFGYCVLGRLIEKVSGMPYITYVQKEVLGPLGIHRMRLGRSLEADRAKDEVRYYSSSAAKVRSVFGENEVPSCYGGWNLEAMDSHGAWIASAPELVRFASSFDNPDQSTILSPKSIAEMFARPKDVGFMPDGKPKPAFYADGWMVRPVNPTQANTWHNGLLDGTSTLLVRRHDGLTWAVLFNTDRDKKKQVLAGLIDPLLHSAADEIKAWPAGEEFKEPH